MPLFSAKYLQSSRYAERVCSIVCLSTALPIRPERPHERGSRQDESDGQEARMRPARTPRQRWALCLPALLARCQVSTQLLRPGRAAHKDPRVALRRLVPVEPLQHDGVLRAQVVRRQGAGLPAEALVGVGEILRACDVRAELKGDSGHSSSRDPPNGQQGGSRASGRRSPPPGTWMLACCKWWDQVVNRFWRICWSK